MTILLIEDNHTIQEGVSEFLTGQGYQLLCAADGETGLNLLQSNTVHLILLDIMLPKIDGLQVLREVRKTSTIPVLMLTAMTDESTQVKSFDELADDYICKPFSLVLLSKRIEALLRRYYAEHTIWEYGKATVDFTGFQAAYDGVDAAIKPKEIKLLEILLNNAGQVLTREQILNKIWGEEDGPFERVVDTYIKNLRKKLHLDCIVTVKGVGYKIEL
ncbi:MAG: response regulator transcription factor [Anaerovoracaceae bacterium]